MGFWLIVFHWLSELYLGLSSKDALYHIWWSVSLWEGEKTSTAVQFLPCCCISDSRSWPLPARRSRPCFASSGSHLRSTVSTYTKLLPTRGPPVISSQPGLCRHDEARLFRPVDPPLISWLAAEEQACAVYNQRLSDCFSTAAVEQQASSCSFPASPHKRAPSACL